MKQSFLILILTAALAGCARPPAAPQTRLSFQQFVNVMAELGTSPPEQRAGILQKHKTGDAEIREFISAYSRDPQRLAEAFDSVEQRFEARRTSKP